MAMWTAWLERRKDRPFSQDFNRFDGEHVTAIIDHAFSRGQDRVLLVADAEDFDGAKTVNAQMKVVRRTPLTPVRVIPRQIEIQPFLSS